TRRGKGCSHCIGVRADGKRHLELRAGKIEVPALALREIPRVERDHEVAGLAGDAPDAAHDVHGAVIQVPRALGVEHIPSDQAVIDQASARSTGPAGAAGPAAAAHAAPAPAPPAPRTPPIPPPPPVPPMPASPR